jgi:hypothetical protein
MPIAVPNSSTLGQKNEESRKLDLTKDRFSNRKSSLTTSTNCWISKQRPNSIAFEGKLPFYVFPGSSPRVPASYRLFYFFWRISPDFEVLRRSVVAVQHDDWTFPYGFMSESLAGTNFLRDAFVSKISFV